MLPQHLLQQCRSNASCSSVAATRAVTAPQRSRDTCCNSAAALPQRELQHYNVASLQCWSVASLQCCSNASLHRCSFTLPLPLPQSSWASCGVVTSDVALSIFVRRTFVRWSCVLWSCALPSCGPAVLRPTSFTTTHGTFQIGHCVRIL
jgi:hypothetical protein